MRVVGGTDVHVAIGDGNLPSYSNLWRVVQCVAHTINHVVDVCSSGRAGGGWRVVVGW